MQSVYSWMGTRIHLVLEDDVADAYNQAMDEWYAAQERQKGLSKIPWVPSKEPLWMDLTAVQLKAWNDMARIIELLGEMNGGLKIPEEEITSDYLVKL